MSTTFDFGPFFRSSVGFDRIFNLLENASQIPTGGNWPPYDIVKTGEDQYAVSLAAAGFTSDELSITHEPNLLVITGQKQDQGKSEYLYRGISGLNFERRFELADHMQVTGASLDNGLLTVELKREVPAAMKPRRIEIGSAGSNQSKTETKQIEDHKIAA